MNTKHKLLFLAMATLLTSACGADTDTIETQQQAIETIGSRGPGDPGGGGGPGECYQTPCHQMCDMSLPSPGTPGYCCHQNALSTCQSSGYYDGGNKDPDVDNDGIPNVDDNCWLTPNSNQANSDNDIHGDACDNCPSVDNDHQYDNNNNGVGDACEDLDDDNIPAGEDNCPDLYNPNQVDTDQDGVGDLCDGCPDTWNPSQTSSSQDGAQDACNPVTSLIWRGFEHRWDYNHRVRKLGNFVDSNTNEIKHIADAGIGKDNAAFDTHFDRVTTGYGRFYQGKHTIKMIGQKAYNYSISRVVHLPASSGHIDRDHNIVLLNGIEIIESKQTPSVMKFDRFDIKIRDYAHQSFTVDLSYNMNCGTGECTGSADYEYDIIVHYLVISGNDGIAMSDIDTVQHAYGWDGMGGTEIFGPDIRTHNLQHAGASGTYQAGVVGLRGFSLDLQKEYHMLELGMRAANPRYDSATNQLQVAVDAFFKNWTAGMQSIEPFSFGETGSTVNTIDMSLIQFRDATITPYIASGGFDTNHVTEQTISLNSLTPRCGGNILWQGPTAPTATFDGYNCFVADFGPDMIPGSGYIWGNGWHYRTTLNTCPLNGDQPWGNNECYAGHPPATKDAFIFDDAFYFTP